MGILQLISTSNFITVNKDLIKELGLEEAILLGELASEYDYWNNKNEIYNKNEIENGYFYSTIENIEEKTTLTAYKQRKCLEYLRFRGIIDIQIRGIPAKRYIKINEEKVIEIFNNKLLKNLTTGCKKTSQLEVKKLNGNNNIINNNIKKEKNKKRKTFEEVIAENNCSEELEITVRDFIDMRKTIKKPMTSKALELLFKNLEKLTNLEEEKIAILNQSIEHSWQTVYPLKTNNMRNSSKGEIKEEEKQEELKEIDISGLTPEEYDLLVKKKITMQELIEKGRVNVG